ncbi:MAG: AAA family ATPase [Chloroflexi bacterium]|nr:AAA family ATPase [Chloroflexota bacterium]
MSAVQLIVLNGVSSAGKTVLCKKLQEVLDEPYIHLEEDRFVFNTYHDRFLDSELAPEIFQKTMLGYYRSLRAFLSAGHNVLTDTGFYTPELLQQCVKELGDESVWLVGVHCALDELERREQARGDRPIGLAKEQLAILHNAVVYDIEVDTSVLSLEECAVAIKMKMGELGVPKAMASLQAGFTAMNK